MQMKLTPEICKKDSSTVLTAITRFNVPKISPICRIEFHFFSHSHLKFSKARANGSIFFSGFSDVIFIKIDHVFDN